jgi:hypothetical protein
MLATLCDQPFVAPAIQFGSLIRARLPFVILGEPKDLTLNLAPL